MFDRNSFDSASFLTNEISVNGNIFLSEIELYPIRLSEIVKGTSLREIEAYKIRLIEEVQDA
jgi:hypothetical protein